jgi:hypothetical protein
MILVPSGEYRPALPGSRMVPVPSGSIDFEMQSSQSFVSCTNKIRPFRPGGFAVAG